MEFTDPIVSGLVLVRPAIRSPDYETSGGATGWSINEDGTAVFRDITAAGNITVEGDIESSNYVPDTTGYHLDYDTGSAEFNDLEARGDIVAGSFATGTTGKRVEVRDDGTFAEVLLFSGDPQETTPGALGSTPGAYGAVTQSFTTLYSNEDGNGYVNVTLVPPFPGSPTPNGAVFVGGSETEGVNLIMSPETKFYSQNILDATAAEVDQPFQIGHDTNRLVMDRNGVSKFVSGGAGNLHLQRYLGDLLIFADSVTPNQIFVNETGTLILQNTNDVNLTTYDSALLIGDTGSEHLAFDGNEIMARVGLLAGTLNLQNNGGTVQIGGYIQCSTMRSEDSYDAGPRATASTTYVRASGTADVTVKCPPSLKIDVCVDARLSISTGTATHAACISWEARLGSGAGTLLVAGNDVNAGIVRAVTYPLPGGRTRQLNLSGLALEGDDIWIGAVIRSNNGANTATAEQISIWAKPAE